MIIIPRLHIAYQNIPKIATTSLTRWFYDSLKVGGLFVEDKTDTRRLFARDHFKGTTLNSFEVAPSKELVEQYPGIYCFALTRDPLRRFLSMYSNRVLFHRELESSKTVPILEQMGVPVSPDINEFVTHLDAYRLVSKGIKHHSAPMTEFLGQDLSIYGRLVDIGEIDSVIAEILAYWERAGLKMLAAEAPKLGRSQTGGPKLGLEVLSEESFERLIDFYRQDYENIPTVDLENIRQAYRDALLNPTVTLLTRKGTSHRRKNSNKLRKCSEEKKYRTRKVSNPAVRLLRVQVKPDPKSAGEPIIQGMLVLAEGVPETEYSLQLQDGGGRRAVEWGLPSPKIASEFPDVKAAANAKFCVKLMPLQNDDHPIELFLVEAGGARNRILVVKREKSGSGDAS